MQKRAGFFGSSVGKKIVMAVTGIMLIGFVVVHMIGNLQLYLPAHGGEYALDTYGTFLRTLLHGSGIWIARAVLLSAVGLHIWAAVGLTLMNWAARPVGYQDQQYSASTFASRWMRVSGVIVLVFIVFHLMHLTIGNIIPGFEHGKVFHNVVSGFQVPWISVFYIIAMLALATHIHHGIWSMLQTLGLSHPRFNGLRNGIATLLTIVVIGGNISFPIAVLTGFVR